MTSAALAWGCALLAFSPSASLLILLIWSKAQLVIVVTTSAFAYLLSSLLSALLWIPFKSTSVADSPLLLLVPSVLSQAIFRCGFVTVYRRVERVIESSIKRHEEEHRQAQVNSSIHNNDTTQDSTQEGEPALSESARLRLELNDWACGIAAGTGFGGMHAIMLYGTLLASESGSLGTLYQPSCSMMPSLVNSALTTFLFSLLDLVLMLLTFYGLQQDVTGQGIGRNNIALLATVGAHLAAALSTTANSSEDGCRLSLGLLSTVVGSTILFFVTCISRKYLPENQRRRIGQDGEMIAGFTVGDAAFHQD